MHATKYKSSGLGQMPGLRNLDFVLAPELVSVYGAVTPAWGKLDLVEQTQTMIECIVERELMMYLPWRSPRRRARRRFSRRR